MYFIFVKKTAYILLFSYKRVRITVYSVQLAVILENFQLALTRSWRRGVGKLLPTTIVQHIPTEYHTYSVRIQITTSTMIPRKSLNMRRQHLARIARRIWRAVATPLESAETRAQRREHRAESTWQRSFSSVSTSTSC
jgi:hypothetical protein